jgi:hypothetical protein
MPYVRENWRDRVLTMADLEEVLCRISLNYHVTDKRFEVVQEALKRVGSYAEYYAKEML